MTKKKLEGNIGEIISNNENNLGGSSESLEAFVEGKVKVVDKGNYIDYEGVANLNVHKGGSSRKNDDTGSSISTNITSSIGRFTSGVDNHKMYMNHTVKYSFFDCTLIIGCILKRKHGRWICNIQDINDKGLCVPDRRVQLCIHKIKDVRNGNDVTDLKKQLLASLNTEAYLLLQKWKEDNRLNYKEFCNDLKYDFADIGNVIKGTDIKGHGHSMIVEKIL
ncbi:DBP2 [Plasmodium brasilianum]|uniref:DBP2 n=1 Tax=Plasmodium brasilianum TaxID=5824 RepID=A0ACB9YGC2_PLABR|nr:DBP2 [Plasmodium brasilianum]